MDQPSPLPFAPLDDFLTTTGVDVPLLRQALAEYGLHCAQEIQLIDHGLDPLGWIEACDYRDALDAFGELLRVKKNEDQS